MRRPELRDEDGIPSYSYAFVLAPAYQGTFAARGARPYKGSMDAFTAGTEPVRGTRRELERHVTFRENHVHIQLEPYEVITNEMAQVLLLRAIELCGEHGFLRLSLIHI